MNKRFNYLLSIAILTVGLLTTAPAQACEFGTQEQPSRESRLYRNNDVGFSFLIPKNYRTMGLSRGMMLVLEPAEFDYTQCVIRNKIPTDGGGEAIFVATKRVNTSSSNSIRSLLFEFHPYMRSWDLNFRNATLDSQPSLVFFEDSRLHGTTMAYIALRSPDLKTFIFISGEQGSDELLRALQSFKFE